MVAIVIRELEEQSPGDCPRLVQKMIDFHTHILPGMDDGSKSVSESLQMLRMEREQGIDLVVLTPHFYSSENSPDVFLRRRQRSWQALSGALEEGMPKLLPGAEVQYFESIGNLDSIQDLCILGTRLLLLEMPFRRWDERTIQTVLSLNGTNGIQIVLAHVERYLSYPGNPAALDLLRRNGILSQMNVSSFDGWLRRRKASAMVREGKVHLFGSDCHNLSGRKPNWDLVPEILWQSMDSNSKALLRQYLIRK